jgi:hypothetical protein
MTFEEDLKADVEPDWVDVDALLNGTLYKLRFKALDGPTWANECDKYPMRPDVVLDSTYGYNLRALTLGVAPLCGARVDGDTTVDMPAQQWAALLTKVDGQTFRRISDAIWALNEYLPSEAVKAAKKALTDSETPSTSPSDSESLPSDSTGGNRPKPGPPTTTKTVD